SGLTASASTSLAWPYSVRSRFPVARSQIFMTLSFPPEASHLLSGLNTTAFTDLMCPVCRINSGLSRGSTGVTVPEDGVGAGRCRSPRFSCSFVCAIPLTRVQTRESKIISDDICLGGAGDKVEADLFKVDLLANGRLRSIDSSR